MISISFNRVLYNQIIPPVMWLKPVIKKIYKKIKSLTPVENNYYKII